MADLSASFASDYLTWDGTETASYEVARRGRQVNQANYLLALPVAKRRQLTLRELAASGGAYTGHDRVFLIPQALLPPDLVPKPADVVLTEDGANRWTALDVGAGKGGQTWKLTCRNLVIAEALADTVWLEKPAIGVDLAGAPTKAWPSGPSPNNGDEVQLTARVQPMTVEVAEQRGIRGPQGNYAIVIDRQLDVSTEDRLRWVNLQGQVVYFDVKGLHNPQRIDELPVLDCELRP